MQATLAAGGWFDGRRVAPAELERLLRQVRDAGREPSQPVVDALAEFGGLTFGTTSVHGIDYSRGVLEFRPEIGDTFPDVEELLGEQLAPLGEVDAGHGMFAMAATGQVIVDYLNGSLTVCYSGLDEMLTSVLLGLRSGTKLRGEWG